MRESISRRQSSPPCRVLARPSFITVVLFIRPTGHLNQPHIRHFFRIYARDAHHVVALRWHPHPYLQFCLRAAERRTLFFQCSTTYPAVFWRPWMLGQDAIPNWTDTYDVRRSVLLSFIWPSPPPHRPPLSLLSLSILYTRLNTNPLTSPPYLHHPPSAAALLTALFQVADCTSHYHHHHNLPVLVVHHRSLTCLAPPLACGRPGAAVATRMEIGYPSSFVVCQHSKQVCLVPGPAIIVRGNASDEPTDICISCSARDLCRSIGSDRASRHVTSRGGNCAARDLCGATTHASSPARIASSGHHHYTVASKQASKPCSRAACSHGSDGAGASRHRASWRSTQAESGDKSQHQPRVGAPAAKYTLVQERKWVSRTEVGGWMGSSRR